MTSAPGEPPDGVTGTVPAARVTVARPIEWSDTDATGHVHNTVANRLMESAEAELMRALGLLPLVPSMPRVRVTYDYRARLWFGDTVTVGLRVSHVGRSSLTYAVSVARDDGTVAITGEVIVVHAPGPSAVPWPPHARRALLGGAPGPGEGIPGPAEPGP